jgi:hypothetical protein
MLTILDHCASQAVAMDAGRLKSLLAVAEIHAAVKENFKDADGGGHICKLCGERVPHPRAAAAHLAVHHRKALESAGTSEGAMKGWDVRGRKTHEILISSGFNHRGTDNGMHRYTGKTDEEDKEGAKGRVINHTMWVDKKTGAWAHESGAHGLGMARGRGNGPDYKSLDKYIGSNKFHDTHALSRNGPVWNRIQ